MIAIDQRFTLGDNSGRLGDCLRACVASQMELDPETVPHFAEMPNWLGSIVDFVNAGGYDFRWIGPVQFPITEPGAPETCIAIGMSPRNVLHAVIVDTRTGEVVHDPHPSRDGLAEPARNAIVIRSRA